MQHTYIDVYSQKNIYIRKTQKQFQNVRPTFPSDLNDRDNEKTMVMMIHAYIHIHIHALHYINVCNYIALHDITLHYITLHYIISHYIVLHYITLHYIILH